MATQSRSKTPYIAGAIIVVVVISALIPYKAWDYQVLSDRYCIEGQVATIEDNILKVNIDTARGENEQPRSLGASVTLQGNIPDYCREGQSVIISMHSGDSLLEKVGKGVEIQFYRDANVLMGLIVPMIAPFHTAAPSMTVKDVNLNGALLLYYETSKR